MTDRTLSTDDLERLRQEREEADRRYNDALTALNRSLREIPELIIPLPSLADSRLDDLKSLVDDPPQPIYSAGWRGWVQRLMWPVLGPLLTQQHEIDRAFLHDLIQHRAALARTGHALEAMLTQLQDELEARHTFEFWVAAWAQQVTPYVDTKDRHATGLVRRINENPVRAVERTLGLMQRRQLAMKRQLEQVMTPASPAGSRDIAEPPRAPATGGTSGVDAFKYVGFEEAFRGSESEISQRLAGYCGHFEGVSDVLDVGCGRGEFLSMLHEHGISARGLDTNPEMVAACVERGLDVKHTDAVSYLDVLSDATLGGLIATQVIEHFRPDYLLRFLELAYHKLRPGSTIILETLNVDSWSAFFGPFLRDLTHERPIPPETLHFLVEASGFQRVELQYSSPADAAAKLLPVDIPATASSELGRLAETFNVNVKKLNTLLFTFLDYAVIAHKL